MRKTTTEPAAPERTARRTQLARNRRAATGEHTGEDHDSQPDEQRITLPNAGELALGGALGCNMAWVSMSFKSMGLFAGAGNGEAILDMVYLVSIVSVVLTFAAASLLHRRVRTFVESRAGAVVLPFGVAVTTLLMPFSSLSGAPGIAALALAGTLSGVFSGLFLMRIGMAYCQVSLRSCVTGAAAGTIASPLLFALFLLFQPFEASVFAASMPLIAAVLLQYGSTSVPHSAPDNADTDIVEGTDTHREHVMLALKLTLCSALVGFANEAARTLYMQMGISSSGGAAYALIQGATGFAATVGTVVIALILASSCTERQARNCYHALVLMLVAGALLLPLTAVFPSQSVHLPYALNDAGYSCFGMFMWVLMISVCTQSPRTQLRTFALVRAGWAIGPLVGLLLGRYVLHLTAMGTGTLFLVMVVGVLSILLVSGFVFSEHDLMRALDIMPFERKRRFQEKCQRVITHYGLSEREGEVMVLLAKGRNLPHIQEQLYLSKSTISTHRQHIYQKLGIHSQQDLINLVQEA